MKASQFVNKLKGIPSKERMEYLIKENLPQDFIVEYQESYFFKRNNCKSEYDDPIKELTNCYDGTSVKIGMITFDLEPKEDSDYYYFAQFEIDLLVINKNLKTIELLEQGTDKHILNRCAQNSEKFLDAILEAAIFMEKCAFDDDLYNNEKLKCDVAEMCSEVAGSSIDYLDFYKVLLGCEL